MRYARQQPLLQAVAQSRNSPRIVSKRFPGNLRGLAQANDASHVFRARPESSLVMAAKEELLQTRAFPDVQRADTLRRIKFVAGEREQIQTQRVHVNRQFARRLHSVRMEVNVGIRGDTANLF